LQKKKVYFAYPIYGTKTVFSMTLCSQWSTDTGSYFSQENCSLTISLSWHKYQHLGMVFPTGYSINIF